MLARAKQGVKRNPANFLGSPIYDSPHREPLRVSSIRRHNRLRYTGVVDDFDKLIAVSVWTVKAKLRDDNPGSPVSLSKGSVCCRKANAYDKRCQYRET